MEWLFLLFALAVSAYLNLKFGDRNPEDSQEPLPGSCYCGHPACTGPTSPYHRDDLMGDD